MNLQNISLQMWPHWTILVLFLCYMQDETEKIIYEIIIDSAWL